MSMSKYIKITLKGEKEPRFVLGTLKNFFLSQGAKVETATDEEVYAAEPALRPKPAPAPAKAGVDPAVVEQLRKGEAYLKEQIAERDKFIKTQEEAIKEHEATIADLREKLAASNSALKEAEALVESLRNSAATAKGSKKADAE